MEIVEINDNLLAALHLKAMESETKRMSYSLKTTDGDGSQLMLNALEVGTRVPIHRHLEASETMICLQGCLDVVFYDLRPNEDCGGPFMGTVEQYSLRVCRPMYSNAIASVYVLKKESMGY